QVDDQVGLVGAAVVGERENATRALGDEEAVAAGSTGHVERLEELDLRKRNFGAIRLRRVPPDLYAPRPPLHSLLAVLSPTFRLGLVGFVLPRADAQRRHGAGQQGQQPNNSTHITTSPARRLSGACERCPSLYRLPDGREARNVRHAEPLRSLPLAESRGR